MRLKTDMTNHHPLSSASSPQTSQESLLESSQCLKVTPEEKAGTIPGSTVAMAVVSRLKLLQDNVWDVKHTRCANVRKQKHTKLYTLT